MDDKSLMWRKLDQKQNMYYFERFTGLIMGLIGLLHVITGIVAFRPTFSQMLAAGLVGSARQPDENRLAFWFTFAGMLMGLTGYLMDWVVRKQGLRLPVVFGYILTALCALGILLIPPSGFWLVLPLGVYLSLPKR